MDEAGLVRSYSWRCDDYVSRLLPQSSSHETDRAILLRGVNGGVWRNGNCFGPKLADSPEAVMTKEEHPSPHVATRTTRIARVMTSHTLTTNEPAGQTSSISCPTIHVPCQIS